METLDICMLLVSGIVDSAPEKLASGRSAFTVLCQNARKRKPFKVAVVAEQAAMNIAPAKGDFVVIANADFYEERRQGCILGAYAKSPGTVNICARDEGITGADRL